MTEVTWKTCMVVVCAQGPGIKTGATQKKALGGKKSEARSCSKVSSKRKVRGSHFSRSRGEKRGIVISERKNQRGGGA